MILSYCSNGDRVSQTSIDRRYSHALREKHAGQTVFSCECGCGGRAVHNDHTIARARCKHIHKAELIWDGNNFVNSCEKAHREWENFKSGEWLLHSNCTERLVFLRENDPEGFRVRVELTQASLNEKIYNT